jgi:diaminopimelate epimerase
MGPVTIGPTDLRAEAGSLAVEGDAVSVGNPHWVIVVEDPAPVALAILGPALEHDPRFPDRVNVEFIAPEGNDTIRMRVWERGVGETQSCGTGACAAAAVAHRRGLVGPEVTVHVPGGTLTVELGDTVRLGGPVTHVFDVDVDLDALRT